MSVDHYENFPVASLLCPQELRPAVRAIYRFARVADDLADEGDAAPAQRLAQLADYGRDLQRAAQGHTEGPWQAVFEPLQDAIERHGLPIALLSDLLSAFTQDVHNPRYADRVALLDYCARSANPIGRLLLHLYGIDERDALAQSDAICSALQLVNFWQDLGRDVAHDRHYVPLADAARQGLAHTDLRVGADSDASRALVRDLVAWSRTLMRFGAPLVHRVPSRAGWELRLVVQGGLRVLDKIEASGYAALGQRPTVGGADLPRLVWRALTMRSSASLATHTSQQHTP